MLHGLASDIRYTARTLRKSPVFTGVAVLSLGLAIGAVTTMFSVVAAVEFNSLPYRDVERLVLAQTVAPPGHKTYPAGERAEPSLATFLSLRQRARSYERLEGIGFTGMAFDDGDGVFAKVTTPGFLHMLGVTPAFGRLFTASDVVAGSEPVVLLSHELWESRFGGDSSAIGRRLTAVDAFRDGRTAYTIIGVMPPRFRFSEEPVDAWLVLPQSVSNAAKSRPFETVGKLARGVTTTAAQTEMRELVRQIGAQDAELSGWSAAVVPLQQGLVESYGVGYRRYQLLAIACFVLLLAVTNLASLVLSRASVRGAEFAIRTAVGGSRFRLACQILTESACVAGAGAAVGTLVAVWGVGVMTARLGFQGVDFVPRVDYRALGFAAATAMAAAMLLAAAPIVHLGQPRLALALRGAGRSGSTRRGGKLHSGLTALSVGLALIALTGAGLLAKDFWRIRDIGFDPRELYENYLTDYRHPITAQQAPDLLRRAVEAVRAVPEVEQATGWTGGQITYLRDRYRMTPAFRRLPSAREFITLTGVSTGYFQTTRMPLLHGRVFTDTDTLAATAVLSSFVADRLWPNDDPIGKEIVYGDSARQQIATVIGVVTGPVVLGRRDPMVYVPHSLLMSARARDTSVAPRVMYRLRSPSPSALGNVRAAVAAVTGLPLARTRPHDFGDSYGKMLVTARFNALALAIFAGFGLLLAAMGIFGVVAYNVASRTREIGVRVALGASNDSIIGLLTRRTLILAAAGTVLGLAGAVVLTRLLKSLVYTTSTTDPLVFATAASMLVVVALVASLIPARHALRVDPVVALRAD